MDIASITAAVSGLKVGKELLTELLNAKVDAKVRAQVNEVLSKLGEAHETLFDMRDELFRLQTESDALRKKLGEYENWEKQLAQYALTDTREAPLSTHSRVNRVTMRTRVALQGVKFKYSRILKAWQGFFGVRAAKLSFQ